MNAELKTLNETLKNMQKNLVAMGEQMEDVVNRIEIISVDKQKFKSEKRYARVGEKVLITNPRDDSHGVVGEVFTVSSIGVSGRIDVKEIMKNNRHWAFKSDEYEVIIEPGQAPVSYAAKLTPNEQRAGLIERAKRFVESQKKERGNSREVYVTNCSIGYWCNARFVVNAEKRTVVCLLKHDIPNGPIAAKGIAKCMPGDVFNADIGKAIALARARALEIPVPEEFLNAVQPNEVVVGMKVKTLDSSTGEVIPFIPEDVVGVKEPCYPKFYDGSYSSHFKIIDDTNAVYANDTQ